jgi:hypothetical protein
MGCFCFDQHRTIRSILDSYGPCDGRRPRDRRSRCVSRNSGQYLRGEPGAATGAVFEVKYSIGKSQMSKKRATLAMTTSFLIQRALGVHAKAGEGEANDTI